ncbi:FAD:protein FMN transferase [Sphingomonas sp. RP10(2022)]|uniref:FAD:protein FMN transferase n=1 Tax=Sphingomonas liriopis TaxID=2949094 RepID=A0A9X2I0I0_9SPHN|nr:FAD:protein FMN transferase [Sphingomonas liriopis]MCP3736250.1 FAD:protein FMN transferase [Sphingomonas liriopis]
MRIALPAAIDARLFAARDPAARVTDLGGETMGTRWSVRAILPAGVPADAVRHAIVARLDGIVAQMSHWSPTSQLSAFNRAPAGRWTILPPDFAHVVAEGLRIAAITDGAFDPAIGRLVDLWGFGPVPVAGPPDDTAIAAARAVSGWRRLAYTPGDRRLRQPGGLSLDLSGIAKGFAVDAIAELLGTLGIVHALVEIGGELVGRGFRPDGQPWWVDCETPPGLSLVPLRLALHGLAVATSGDYRRGAHTLDPRTGRAIQTGVVAASVIHATALAADAWATALTVLGPDAAIPLATDHAIAARIVTVIDCETREHLSPALAAMLAD